MMNLGLIGGLIVLIALIAGVFSLVVWATGMVAALALFFVLTSVFMILVVLIQRPRGGGLSGAFGGAGGSAQAAFGAKTGDMLTWVTVVCFAAFLTLSIGLTWAVQGEKRVEPTATFIPADQGLPGAPDAIPTTDESPDLGDAGGDGLPTTGEPDADASVTDLPDLLTDDSDAAEDAP